MPRCSSILLGHSCLLTGLCNAFFGWWRRCSKAKLLYCHRGKRPPGKEVVARAMSPALGAWRRSIHAVNCGALPGNCWRQNCLGMYAVLLPAPCAIVLGDLSLASRGTLFLDEIGDMPPHYR